MSFLVAVRALVDELNAASASGLISRDALVLLGVVHRLLIEEERRDAR